MGSERTTRQCHYGGGHPALARGIRPCPASSSCNYFGWRHEGSGIEGGIGRGANIGLFFTDRQGSAARDCDNAPSHKAKATVEALASSQLFQGGDAMDLDKLSINGISEKERRRCIDMKL